MLYLPRISSNSPTPLKCSVSKMNLGIIKVKILPLKTITQIITNIKKAWIIEPCVKRGYSLQENVINLFSNVRSKSQKLSIYSMEYCLEKISFTRVFAVEQLKKLKAEDKISTLGKYYI
jgi:hypothetical protein